MENKSKENLQKSVSFLQELLNKSSFSQRYTITVKNSKYWRNNQGYSVERAISLAVKPNDEKETQELDEIQKKIQNQFVNDPNVYLSLDKFHIDGGFQVGEKFSKYSKLNYVLNGGEGEIVHQEGEIILIDFWATWCGPCQGPMQHNQDMLEKNTEKWSNKVRIIAISFDDDNEAAIKRITDRKWNKMTHFRLNGRQSEHSINKDLQSKSIPFVVLVDKQGVIDFKGHPSHTDLEQRINILLEGSGQSVGLQSEMTSEQNKKGNALMKTQLQQHMKQLEINNDEISLAISQINQTIIKSDSQAKLYGALNYSSSVQKKQVDSYNKLKSYIISVLGEKYPIKKKKETIIDNKAIIAEDMKQLAKIYENYNLKSIENQICVKLQQVSCGKSLVPSRSDHILQHQKIFIEKDVNKEQIEKATKEQRNYIEKRLESDQYPSHLLEMNNKNIRTTEQKCKKPQDNEDAYRDLKDIIQQNDLLELDLYELFKYDTQFNITLKRHRVFNYKGEMKYKYYSKGSIKYSIRKSDVEKMKKEVLDKLFEKVDKNLFDIKEDVINVVSIEEGKNCSTCNCELSVPYYFNYFQKNHYCLNCGDKRDESIKTINQFAVPHNLVLITTTDKDILNVVDEYKLGKDVQPKPDQEIKQDLQNCCYGCEKFLNCIRYNCLTCLPGPYLFGYIMFCYDCVKKFNFEKIYDESFKKYFQRNSCENHSQDHIYLKVLTSEGGYNDF